jgi:hypothetical protein
MPEEAERLGFLSRWSRRKRGEEVPEPEAAPPAEIPFAEAAPVAPEAPEAQATTPPEPEFDVSTLPPIETLDASSDFTVFLKPGVPEALRTAALRKAWLADPLIRDYMSPLDYAWDFNTPGGLPLWLQQRPRRDGRGAAQTGLPGHRRDRARGAEKPEGVALAEAGRMRPSPREATRRDCRR